MSTTATTCSQLLDRHRDSWKAATEHPFLAGCKDGSVTASQFNTWLEQDYLFGLEFAKFLESLALRAPKDHSDVVMEAIPGLQAEMKFFQGKVLERNLCLDTPPLPALLLYSKFLDSLSTQPYPVQAIGLWAIEAVYNEAWNIEACEPYKEFAERWGANSSYGKFVKVLESQADDALKDASEEAKLGAERVFVEIAKLEVQFWNMAFENKE